MLKFKNIFIHPGFPKTGTTLLQQEYFPKIPHFYLSNKNNEFKFKIIKKINSLNNFEFNSELNQMHFDFEKIIENTKNLNLIISYEGFFNPLRKKGITNTETIKRLNFFFSTYGEVRFIICIRKYFDIFSSYYDQVYDQIENILKLDDIKKLLDNFKYSNLLNFLENNEINYKIFFFEDLKLNQNNFINEISTYLELNSKKYKISNNKIINSTKEKKNSLFKLSYIKNTFPSFQNFIYNIFSSAAYVRKFKKSKRKIFIRRNNNNLSEIRNQINEYYGKDFLSIKVDIKKKMQELKYLD